MGGARSAPAGWARLETRARAAQPRAADRERTKKRRAVAQSTHSLPQVDRDVAGRASSFHGAHGEAGDEAFEQEVEGEGDRDGDEDRRRLQRLPEEHVA